MPLGPGVRYRWKNGVRLAFKGNKVVETAKKVGEGKLTPIGQKMKLRGALGERPPKKVDSGVRVRRAFT